jgi:hypothetical protein
MQLMTYLKTPEVGAPLRYGKPCTSLDAVKKRLQRLAKRLQDLRGTEVRVRNPSGSESLYAVVTLDGAHLHLKTIEGTDALIN